MKKVILLLSIIATLCASCGNEPKNEGPDVPVIPVEPEKPNLGYIDFANWWQIFLKDIETAQPKIKGTLVFDSTMSLGERILAYKYDTDGGVFTTLYGFDHKKQLFMIYSAAAKDSMQVPIYMLNKYIRAISSELNSYVYSNVNGQSIEFSFVIYKNDKQDRWISDLNFIGSPHEKYHSSLWKYVDKYISNGIPKGEWYFFDESWRIDDTEPSQTSGMPYSTFCLSGGNGDFLGVRLERITIYSESMEEVNKREPLRWFMMRNQHREF